MFGNEVEILNIDSDYDNLIDVTKDATITYEIKDSTNTTIEESELTKNAGTYKIAYSIKYKTFTDHQVVNVTVK